MPSQTRRNTDAQPTNTSATTTANGTTTGDNAFNAETLANETSAASSSVISTPWFASLVAEDLPADEKKQKVVLYITLNSTTHKDTEIPEVLAALKKGEAEGHGHRELLPISDPYWTKKGDGSLDYHDESYEHSLGKDAAGKMTWWHDDEALDEGQVRVGGQVLTLGTQILEDSEWGQQDIGDVDLQKHQQIRNDWQTLLLTLGMTQDYVDATLSALFGKGQDDPRMLASGNGATNELVQYVMSMYRAEIGEYEISDLVLSGHHYSGGEGIWGEKPGTHHDDPGNYDDTSDLFAFADMLALKSAFPKAYAQIKTVQLAACNTHDLGQYDAGGNPQSTNNVMKGMFDNVEMTSYWREVLAPSASNGAETNGEWILDVMRTQGGDKNAINDSRHNEAGLKRSTLNDAGDLEEIKMKTNTASYGGAKRQGLRKQNKDFDQRTDLADYVYTAQDLPPKTATR